MQCGADKKNLLHKTNFHGLKHQSPTAAKEKRRFLTRGN